jgi:predicted DCC family thiol-disulfide oxidoreductase YuxK
MRSLAESRDHRRLVLLYDADCGFCRWAVAWTLDRDAAGVVEPISIQSPRGSQLLADLAECERLRAVRVISADGSRRSGGAALGVLLDALKLPGLARLATLSPPLTDLVYRSVADNRRHFSRLVSAKAKRRADERLAALDAQVRKPPSTGSTTPET